MRVTQNQLDWFRLRRSGLIEPFGTPEETAASLVGVQAQLQAAADQSFRARTRDCTLEDLVDARVKRRTIVRFWGQRNTVHIYSTADWPLLHAALQERDSLLDRRIEKAGVRREFDQLVRRIEKRLESGDRLTYKDVKSKKFDAHKDKWVLSYVVFMRLVRLGVTCHGPDDGSQSTFVHREHWVDQEWDPPDTDVAHCEVATRYLRAYGPAEPHDLAFWFGTTLTKAKKWIASMGDRCTEVTMGDRTFSCLTEDLDELKIKPPARGRWPVRLLYRFDPLLLATKDKSWLIDGEHYKQIWRASAHVAPALLVGGRIAGSWRYDRRSRGLEVKIEPFGSLTKAVMKGVEEEAERVASFLRMQLLRCESG